MIALVTGASSGIGEATARRLARERRDGEPIQLVLVARREERLRTLADELGGATVIAVDLVDPDAGQRIAETVEREHGALHLLVNNAGWGGRSAFADGGYEDIRRHMEINFDAAVRLTEALLPLLRRSAPSSIVNVSSTAARIGRPKVGSYGTSKSALSAWTDALHLEEGKHGIHVGQVLPGFVSTEGFPQEQLMRSRRTRWMVSSPDKVAEAILDVAWNGKWERYVPRAYGLVPVARACFPGLTRRALGG
jgi:short-subunit dehydrogenase